MTFPALATLASQAGNAAGIVGSISSIASGVKGLFGSKKKKKSIETIAREQAHIQGELQKDQWDVNMSKAREYGIHPLAALGIQPNIAPIPTHDAGDIKGQNLERSAQAIQGGRQDQALYDLALERAGLENDLLRSQISNVNRQAGDPPVHNSGYNTYADENVSRYSKDGGLTAGSADPAPAAKKFKVGDTPYGPVHINLPPSGQADEYGEIYGAIKGIEYMAKRGYVHYSKFTKKHGKRIGQKLNRKLKSVLKRFKKGG
jgi:hypothetical protein